ncbi:hypothetical protein LDENG_00214910 [Lucifuga dentata]|nr:hypothetical protein LDENG_00214910 [Lucifuga dentata]
MVAEFVDYFLSPMSWQIDNVKDTFDFVHKVRTLKLSQDCFLFSMDVESMYTNIETNMGIKAIRLCLQTFPSEGHPDEAILQLLHLGLTKNNFLFNGQFFLQTRGTVMGKKFSPSYANIYMAHWEDTVKPKCPFWPTSYLCYLDDIWGVWSHSRKHFQQWLDILNNHHPTISLSSLS